MTPELGQPIWLGMTGEFVELTTVDGVPHITVMAPNGEFMTFRARDITAVAVQSLAGDPRVFAHTGPVDGTQAAAACAAAEAAL